MSKSRRTSDLVNSLLVNADNSVNIHEGTQSPYFQLDTAATPTLQPGMFGWNDAYGTADLRLKGNNVTLQLGQEILARVVNKTGVDLLESDYKVVRVRVASEGGAQGQRLAVVLAQGDNDPDSATTLGVVTENIANNQEGFITILGNVNNINTTGSLQGETWVDGDVLYLSPTTPGVLTKVKPTAPNHTVTIGYVVYAHATQGRIFVKVDNGYELDELHNVLITTPSSGQLLRYNGTVWQNWTPTYLTSVPTLDQVTTAGNTTTNAITVGGLNVGSVFKVSSVGSVQVTNFRSTGFDRTGLPTGAALEAGFDTTNNRGFLQTYNTATSTYLNTVIRGASIIYQDASGTLHAQFAPTTNNLLINTTTDAGYKLDVSGTTRVTGTLTVGQIITANGTSDLIMQTHVAASSVLTVRYNGSQNATGANKTVLTLDTTFNPTSGGSQFTGLTILPTINQTGTANGITRGIHINPTLTAAVDFRAIETVRGNVIFGSTSGSVGIGTTTPNYILDVYQTNVKAQIRSTGENQNATLFLGTPFGGTSSPKVAIIARAKTSWSRADLAFCLSDNQSSNSVEATISDLRMVILSDGKVGVNVANPTYQFQVSGDIALSGSLVPTAGSQTLGTFTNRFGDVWAGGLIVGSTFYGDNHQSASGTLYFKEGGGVEKMRMTSVGNFLIGTTTDTGEKLQVNGTVRASAFAIGATAGWTGTINIPTNPPGQQNIDVQGGIIVNVY